MKQQVWNCWKITARILCTVTAVFCLFGSRVVINAKEQTTEAKKEETASPSDLKWEDGWVAYWTDTVKNSAENYEIRYICENTKKVSKAFTVTSMEGLNPGEKYFFEYAILLTDPNGDTKDFDEINKFFTENGEGEYSFSIKRVTKGNGSEEVKVAVPKKYTVTKQKLSAPKLEWDKENPMLLHVYGAKNAAGFSYGLYTSASEKDLAGWAYLGSDIDPREDEFVLDLSRDMETLKKEKPAGNYYFGVSLVGKFDYQDSDTAFSSVYVIENEKSRTPKTLDGHFSVWMAAGLFLGGTGALAVAMGVLNHLWKKRIKRR